MTARENLNVVPVVYLLGSTDLKRFITKIAINLVISVLLFVVITRIRGSQPGHGVLIRIHCRYFKMKEI